MSNYDLNIFKMNRIFEKISNIVKYNGHQYCRINSCVLMALYQQM